MNTNIIIAFDGPDNVGKGTQIALLRKYYPQLAFCLSNLDRPAGHTDKEKIDYGLRAMINQLDATQALHNKGIPQIVDRMHYTEYAYSIFRGGHELKTILDYEQKYTDLKSSYFTIIFIDTAEHISQRDDNDSVYNRDDLDNIQKVIDRFKEIAEHSIFDNIVIDINGKDIPTVQKEVIAALENKFPELKKHHN